MTRLEKRSFYAFLGLYLISSLLFLALAMFWFYVAHRSSEERMLYYKMRHLADTINSKVITAHMQGRPFALDNIPPQYHVALFNTSKRLLYGTPLPLHVDFNQTFYFDSNNSVLISTGANEHLGVHYVVVQTQQFKEILRRLQTDIFWMSLVVFSMIVLLAVILSKIFMRPIHKKMQEIETFVKNTAHELNTPITALIMSTSRAQQKKVYDEKIIRNISISTKQLHDMYRSLTYLSFEQHGEADEAVDFFETLTHSIAHFNELLESKKITATFEGEPTIVMIAPSKATMLVNNLLGNAIKYSPPRTTIVMTLHDNRLSITDSGIGISPEKLNSIFLRFHRANAYAGGFGVGLSIVKSICDDYHIGVTVHSKEHKGTTVTLTFTA
ncbi:MAG: sensor histidine kinase [Sulfurimonas sp.]|nr:MAG: sensor histidine kinase [Sulfurimonas sp.]